MATKKRRKFILKVDEDHNIEGTPTVSEAIAASMSLLALAAEQIGIPYNQLLDEIKEVHKQGESNE